MVTTSGNGASPRTQHQRRSLLQRQSLRLLTRGRRSRQRIRHSGTYGDRRAARDGQLLPNPPRRHSWPATPTTRRYLQVGPWQRHFSCRDHPLTASSHSGWPLLLPHALLPVDLERGDGGRIHVRGGSGDATWPAVVADNGSDTRQLVVVVGAGAGRPRRRSTLRGTAKPPRRLRPRPRCGPRRRSWRRSGWPARGSEDLRRHVVVVDNLWGGAG